MMNKYLLNSRQRKQVVLLGLLTCGVLILFLLSLTVGVVPIPASEALAYLLPDWLQTSFLTHPHQQSQIIVESIRLPRTLLAVLVGGVLALCGAITQGLFRNPLADPSLIGVTAGAAAGGSLAIFLGGTFFASSLALSSSISLVSLGAFVGGLLTVALVYQLSNNRFGTSVTTMLLVGVAISAMTASLISFLEYVSSDSQLREISLWRMGGFDNANMQQAWFMFSVLLVIGLALINKAQVLNVLLLGESEARHLGVNVKRLKAYMVLTVALGVGASVAVAGTIAFVGLIVPHLVRIVIGPDHRYLLPCSILAGAVLMLLSDICARTLLAPSELPVGLLTAIVGGPVFILLLQRRYRYGF